MRFALALLVFAVGCAQAQRPERGLPGFATDTSRRAIDLGELQSGGPPKDGIPSIDAPRTVSADAASGWVGDQEPVILLRLDGQARIYPLQVLIWHEIANDTLAGRPVAVTFCPLCYSAVAFDRRIETDEGERTLEFGVSGLLRFSDLVMFDRQTETLWQQFTGDALVGEFVGTTLTTLPAQIVSFAQARDAAPRADVLSRETGHARDYGRNPYAGYDDVSQTPLFYRGETPGEIAPMARVVAVEAGGAFRLYPADGTRQRGVTNDQLAGVPVAVFHTDGATTALGEERIAGAREVGTTGAFDRRLRYDGESMALTFRWSGGQITDAETGSVWDVTGQARSGPLAGAALAALQSHDTFAFAWFAFRPETSVFEESE